MTKQIAKQFREVQLNGTWISTNLKRELNDVTWEEANTKIGSLNTIAALAFHINYYVAGVNQVFAGGALEIRDKFSFDLPLITNEKEWETLKQKIYKDAEEFAQYIEQMSEAQLSRHFVKDSYGSYFRNITGQIEHSYYHLGQIVILKKLIREDNLQIERIETY